MDVHQSGLWGSQSSPVDKPLVPNGGHRRKMGWHPCPVFPHTYLAWLHLEQVCEPGSRPGYGDVPASAKISQCRIEALGSRVEAAQLRECQHSFGGRLQFYFICSVFYMVPTDAETDFCYVAAHLQAEGALQIPLRKDFSFPKKNHWSNSVIPSHIAKFIGEHVFTLYMCVCVCNFNF